MECKNCGAQIPDNSLKCEVCGASLLDEMSDFDDETTVIDRDELREAAAAGAAAADSADEIYDENERIRSEQKQRMLEDKKKQLSEIERRRNEKRKRQRRKKALIVALICALAVGGAGIGAYYVAKGLNGGNVSPSPSPSASVAAASPSASPLASPSASPAVSVSPSPSAAASSQNDSSWTATGNNGNAQAANSNTASQRTATNTASSGASSSGGSTSKGSSSSANTSGAGSAANGSASGSGSSSVASSQITNSGLVSEPISSRQVTGGEVIYNEGTGRYLMTFIMDGKRYYANVSEGSTTDQIQNKSFTIDAAATQESYGGNTVYEISSMTNTSGSYILADSSTRLLTAGDIQGMSKYDLALARNEIFARHGRKFQTPEYNRYFSAKSWYKVNPNYNYSDDNANLNATEKQNVQFILNAEKNK